MCRLREKVDRGLDSLTIVIQRFQGHGHMETSLLQLLNELLRLVTDLLQGERKISSVG